MRGKADAEGLRAAGPGVVLRPASESDEPFLRRLHADRRAEELAPLGWSEADVQSFLDLQLRAQEQGYRDAYPGADSWIVTDATAPVGRLLVDRAPDRHHVVDVAVLASRRGCGVGTAVLREVLAVAADAGVPVRLRAARSDPRLVAWYERLGFRVVGQDDLHVDMVAVADRVG